MELRMHSHRWVARAPDWIAAAVSGFVAGAILMVLELLWATNLMGASPWDTSHKIAAITMGPDILNQSGFNVTVVGVALITHYVLGVVFGMILAAIITPFQFDSSPITSMFVGAVFGIVLYLINFYGVVYLFPWFAEMRGMVTLLGHMIFGMVAGVMYWQLERQRA